MLRSNAKAPAKQRYFGDDAPVTGIPVEDKNGGPNHLAEWREYRKLTQAALAELVGTNANMISYLESGERGLTAKWLRRLAPALETTPGMLLDHSPLDISSEVIDIWINLNPLQKRQLSEIACVLAKGSTSD